MSKPIQMYERSANIPLPASASALASNLSLLTFQNKTYIGVIHKGEFLILCLSKENEIINKLVPKLSPQQMILQGTWIWWDTPLLVLITTSAVQIFDWDGGILLHTHHISSPSNTSGSSSLRGIAALPSGRICVGIHTGEVLLLNLKDSDNLAFVEEGRIKWFSHPVSSLATKGLTLAAAGSCGTIVIAKDEETLQKGLQIPPYGDQPCITCLALMDGVAIAGYLTGYIRLFGLDTGGIIAEVCAHAGLVSSLDLAKASSLLLSVSEDTFFRVWRVDLASKTLIEHKHTENIKNGLLCGGRFGNENGTALVVSSYDTPFLYSFLM